jgi:hypothetical protein
MTRPQHWLDKSLEQCLAQNLDQLPNATALMIINLTGSIRSLERQINEQSELLQFLYEQLMKSDPDLAIEYFRQGNGRLPIEEVVVREEVA